MRKIDAFKNEHELRDRNRGRSACVITRRDGERPDLKPFVVQTVAASVPEQNLDPVAGSIEKYKKVTGKRVLAHNAGYQCRQAVETLAHISRLQADERLHCGWQGEHCATGVARVQACGRSGGVPSGRNPVVQAASLRSAM